MTKIEYAESTISELDARRFGGEIEADARAGKRDRVAADAAAEYRAGAIREL